MKKIENINNNKIEQSLMSEYVKALKNEDFMKLVTNLKIKEDIAKKYTSKLESTVCELNNCKKCKSLYECKNRVKGFVLYPREEKERLVFDYKACKYEQNYLIEEKKLVKTFDEPINIKNAKMSEIDLTDKKRALVIKWIKNFYKNYESNKNQKGLYLHGSFGSGKSYLLAALFNELSKKGNDAIIVYYPELLRRLKESFSDDFSDIMNEIKRCSLLLIDDIGAESVSSWSRDEILGTILQYRMDSSLPTFFTSNLNIEELEHHLSITKNGVDIVKAKRIIERIKQLTEDMELISQNRRK